MEYPCTVHIRRADTATNRSGGSGLRVAWGRAESPFGCCTLAWCQHGLCHLGFGGHAGTDVVPPEARALWPSADWARDETGAAALAGAIFHPEGAGPAERRVFVRATAFRVAVWRALLEIPVGCTAGYGEIATRIGAPGAARAVGTACAANPVAVVIPCHRVVRADGSIDGFRWGTDRKRVLLAAENSRI